MSEDRLRRQGRSDKDAGTSVDLLERILKVYQRQFDATAQATGSISIVERRRSLDILSNVLNQEDFQRQLDDDSMNDD